VTAGTFSIGTLTGLLDLLDERRLSPGESATLAGLLLDGGADPLPDWQHERAEFEAALTTRAAAAGSAFDARRRRHVPLVDAASLLRSTRRLSWKGGKKGRTSGWAGVLWVVAFAVLAMLWRG
jgi:hypothetical protein